MILELHCPIVVRFGKTSQRKRISQQYCRGDDGPSANLGLLALVQAMDLVRQDLGPRDFASRLIAVLSELGRLVSSRLRPTFLLISFCIRTGNQFGGFMVLQGTI